MTAAARLRARPDARRACYDSHGRARRVLRHMMALAPLHCCENRPKRGASDVLERGERRTAAAIARGIAASGSAPCASARAPLGYDAWWLLHTAAMRHARSRTRDDARTSRDGARAGALRGHHTRDIFFSSLSGRCVRHRSVLDRSQHARASHRRFASHLSTIGQFRAGRSVDVTPHPRGFARAQLSLAACAGNRA